jgi:hypothetical protein
LQTNDGGYLLAGRTYSFGAGEDDFWLVKTDANGDSLWSQTYGGFDYEECYSIQQTTDGGYILGGVTRSFGAGDFNFWLVKTDAVGTEEWSRPYGGSNMDFCHSVQQTSDGGFVLAGNTESYGAGGWDYWLVKTNAVGDELWSRTFGGSGYDWCNSVQQRADGGYVLSGNTESYGAGTYDFWLIRTNTDGDSIWSRTFGGSEWDRCQSGLWTTDGVYVLAGETYSFGAGNSDFWMLSAEFGSGSDAGDRSTPLPTSLSLSAYPNPFNPSTTISFDLPQAMKAQIGIFDIRGRLITTLADESFSAGSHTLRFDGSALSSGVYLARLQTDNYQQTAKLILLK